MSSPEVTRACTSGLKSYICFAVPDQIPVVRREHFNRWYTAGAYYVATLASTLPTQTICTLSYACIVYWLTGMPAEFVRFGTFCWTLILVSYVSLCVGLLNGSMFNVKVRTNSVSEHFMSHACYKTYIVIVYSELYL